jgi:aryl-alcohol dehydrogenase-like predicted oxidoreductase
MNAAVHEVKDLSIATLRRQIAESRGLLSERLRLYQIHSATLESGVLDDEEVLTELSHLHSKGLTIGLTVTGRRQSDVIRRALDVKLNGANPFQVVQATWNLLEPSAGAALADAKGRGWGVIIKEALGNGRLTDRNATGDLTLLRQQADAHGATIDALALAAVLSQPWADVVLSGAATVDQLHSNLVAVDLAEAVDAWPKMAQPPTEYWAHRSALAWE